MTIQWFPGHMAKAKRQVEEKLKLVDVVIELLDARIPLSSRNPMLEAITAGKPRIILLTKKDLADPGVSERWIEHFAAQGIFASLINTASGEGMRQIPQQVKRAVADKWEKLAAKGIKHRAVKTMVLGIPNVGKSSFINRLVGSGKAQTGDRPGVTKGQQWLRVGREMELLDTPGILWPKFDDAIVGLRLAVTGAIKDEIVDKVEIAYYLIDYLKTHYFDFLKDRYQIEDGEQNLTDLIEQIGRRRGCVISGGEIDHEKTAELVLRDFRGGKIGRISLEQPEDWQ
jgi:ribosome biogenesis GTPase A